MPTRYGMVTDIRNMPALSQLAAGGVVPLFSGNDPGGIAAIQQAMAAAGGNAGLWIPADSRGPQEYVNWVKTLMAAAPQAKHIDLNMEAIATGAPGTPGWNYSEDVLSQLEPYLRGREWSVSPMANQDWYNYQAATNRGGQVWPQAYQGDMSGIDPQGVINRVAMNNVDPRVITPLLGNAGQAGFGHLYGIDLPGFRPENQFRLNPNAAQLLALSADQQRAQRAGVPQAPIRAVRDPNARYTPRAGGGWVPGVGYRAPAANPQLVAGQVAQAVQPPPQPVPWNAPPGLLGRAARR